jgi:parvulin-like peptidyl-prolyl isomerase
VSGVVKTSLGFHILTGEEVRAAKPADFKTSKNDLKQAILADKISKAWPGYLQELRDKAKYETGAKTAK